MTLSGPLRSSPLLYPLNLASDGSAVQVVRLNENDYALASFLDDRMLTTNTQWAWIPWDEFSEAASELPIRCHFIFHLSHAGSTLLSRLLGEHPTSFALREPGILQALAQGAFPERLDLFLGLWSRVSHPQQTAIIKATSFVSEIAPQLMQRVPDARALLMFVPASTFLPALLDGAMSDIDDQAATRLQRLQHRGLLQSAKLAELSPGERVAMSWLAEMTALAAVAQLYPNRTMWLNFDDFLKEPPRNLTDACRLFGLAGDSAELLDTPLMQRYAKKIEVKYDSNFRQQLLDAAAEKYASEVARGIEWLDTHAPSQHRPSSRSLLSK